MALDVTAIPPIGWGAMANQLGKRYRCSDCGTELICIQDGSGEFLCCDVPMTEFEIEPLPSGD